MADIDEEMGPDAVLDEQTEEDAGEGQEEEALEAEDTDDGGVDEDDVDDVEVEELEASDIGSDDDQLVEDDEESETGEEGAGEAQTCSLSDDDDDNDVDPDPLRSHIGKDYFQRVHPGSCSLSYEEVLSRARIVRDPKGAITDDRHRTLPTMTRYEYARAQGTRAAQINAGSPPLVDVPDGLIDGLQIAALEIKAKVCPLIVRRPLPGGKDEYWHLRDLEIVHGF